MIPTVQEKQKLLGIQDAKTGALVLVLGHRRPLPDSRYSQLLGRLRPGDTTLAYSGVPKQLAVSNNSGRQSVLK